MRIGTSLILTLPILIVFNTYAQADHPRLEGPYLGQTPPGLTALPFAPGIVNTQEWGDVGSFSPDMQTFYVARWKHTADAKEPESLRFNKVGNRWHKTLMPTGTRKPSFSPDGKTRYFRGEYQERTADGWSELKSLGPAFEAIRIMGLTASAKGTLVLDENASSKGGYGILRYSRVIKGKREEPKPLPKTINTGKWNAHPFIAPDESYIMWDGERQSGYGASDIYISFQQKDGAWGEAINLGEKVNTEAREGGPQVTPDGKYLLFNRMVPYGNGKSGSQSDLFWIDAQIIEALRPKE
ncbi:hypothetical protein [Bowmanella pacifica]|uniref:WD40-like Beta Propeller Repeat n=1 Tax=Bowmanella pacifica TaxID=502051 RepID=A0A918DL95_9ALTE|nr:hypothetical protein [Bowmanella pacifica]GGO73476.1 hypothetical protein GCM10010982_34050 [Bowmanella pacifica]